MSPSLGRTLLCALLAGGMGWGIRGQYGHETGAMLAGVLVGFVLIGLFCQHFTPWAAARVVAFLAIGVAFGGSETYGQTIGLTQDPRLIGNYDALRWGLLGLALKGGLWIGFAGAFLGMALSGKRYRAQELVLLLWGLLLLLFLGWAFLNQPFDPAKKILPKLYFSATRVERWGGLLFAFLGLLGWLGAGRKDTLAVRLGLWGFLAGALGFALGQCVQAYHAWHLPYFKTWAVEPHLNWWNAMEITFGSIWGFVLGLGVWLNRRAITPPEPTEPELPTKATWILTTVHAACLYAWQFGTFSPFEDFGDLVFPIAIAPVLLASSTAQGPFLVALPLVALPIAGKSLKELCYEHPELSPWLGWPLLFLLPVGGAAYAALRLANASTVTLAKVGLLTTVWLYFGLNFAFFRLPWVWAPWTGRTPSGIFYTVAAVVLTGCAVSLRRPDQPQPETPELHQQVG